LKVSVTKASTIYASWRKVLAGFVEGKQESIKFGDKRAGGDPGKLDELEADEAVFRKTDIGNNEVQWQEYVGLKRRGDKGSLYVKKRDSASSQSSRTKSKGMVRAVPPPMSVDEWDRIQKERAGKGSLVHTDGAQAYKRTRPGVLQDGVNHSSRKGGPSYTKRVKHVLPDGTQHSAIGGTQSMDGWWAWGKKNCFGVNAAMPGRVNERIREAQWRSWLGERDRWAAAGEVLSWVPE